VAVAVEGNEGWLKVSINSCCDVQLLYKFAAIRHDSVIYMSISSAFPAETIHVMIERDIRRMNSAKRLCDSPVG
jgi:hypothetical protein